MQTLSAVALHATTTCTDDASIVGLHPLNWAIVSCLVLHVVQCRVDARTCVHIALYMHALTQDHYHTSFTDMKWRGTYVYETLQCEQNDGLELAWSW